MGKKITPNLYSLKDNVSRYFYTFLYRVSIQNYLLWKYKKKTKRFLEIGPGDTRIPDFETVNLIKNNVTDFVGDVYKRLPFADNTFDIIYASHVLEHAPWYMLDSIIQEWRRILKINGSLEIWVPDGLKIAEAFVNAEKNGASEWRKDNWYRFNDKQDPSVWFAARMFSYGDGSGARGHRNWHRAAFSPRLLQDVLIRNDFKNITQLTHSDCRGFDHGWINLGFRGEK